MDAEPDILGECRADIILAGGAVAEYSLQLDLAVRGAMIVRTLRSAWAYPPHMPVEAW